MRIKRRSWDLRESGIHLELVSDLCLEIGKRTSFVCNSKNAETVSLTWLFRRVGYRLAKGETLEEILSSMDGVSEGVSTALALEQLLKKKVSPKVFDFKFPIISGVSSIVKGKLSPKIGLKILMQYPIKDENRD